MEILDIHSHILPGIDDGAKDLEESIKLLEMLKEQGVTSVIATPHFYGMQDSIEGFIERRQKAWQELSNVVSGKDLPQIFIGGEILYFPGMGGIERIKELTITGTKYILLEFPEIDFNETICNDIKKMHDNFGLNVIIAHIERYKKFKHYNNLLDLVFEGDCEAQVNSSSFVGGVFEKQAHKLMKKGIIKYIGSDAHSTQTRPPYIKQAYEVIAAKYGKERVEELIKNSQAFLNILKA